MTSNKALFSSIKVGNNHINHRVVFAPVTRIRASPEGVPTDLMAKYYEQRTSEGGLLITEGTFVSLYGGGIPKMPGIYSSQQIEGWKKVTNAVHNKKGVIYLQIASLGRSGSKNFHPNKEQIGSASAVAISGQNPMGFPYEIPKAFSIDEIKEIVGNYRQAALNAIEAGFDGVEIHGANGYLIDQFINSSSNLRTDIYGGSITGRARFPLEILKSVVEAIGAERVGIRFSPGGTFQGMGDESVVETWSYLTTEIQNRYPNLGYLHFIEARSDMLTEEVNKIDSLEPYRQIWKGPFISSGGFSTAIDYSIEVAEKTGNLISFGRSFIANPDLPQRLANGWELNNYDRSTFYSGDAEGYITYPFYDAKN